MKTLTLKGLEQHQDETLTTLRKEYEEAWKEAQKAMDKVDVITNAMARFQTQILTAQLMKSIDNFKKTQN